MDTERDNLILGDGVTATVGAVIIRPTAQTPDAIERYRMLVLRSAMALECLGMKRKGRAVTASVRAEFGLDARTKRGIYEEFCAMHRLSTLDGRWVTRAQPPS